MPKICSRLDGWKWQGVNWQLYTATLLDGYNINWSDIDIGPISDKLLHSFFITFINLDHENTFVQSLYLSRKASQNQIPRDRHKKYPQKYARASIDAHIGKIIRSRKNSTRYWRPCECSNCHDGEIHPYSSTHIADISHWHNGINT